MSNFPLQDRDFNVPTWLIETHKTIQIYLAGFQYLTCIRMAHFTLFTFTIRLSYLLQGIGRVQGSFFD